MPTCFIHGYAPMGEDCFLLTGRLEEVLSSRWHFALAGLGLRDTAEVVGVQPKL